jgi:glycosyltransferase involved in cell wall biosynthesis
MPVFVLCPDIVVPAGGLRKLYRLVEVLNKNKVEAYMLHEHPGFRVNWFQSSAPVCALDIPWSTVFRRRLLFSHKCRLTEKSVRIVGSYRGILSASDVLVLPEIYEDEFETVAPGVPRVLFNQGIYNTLQKLQERESIHSPLFDRVFDSSVRGTLCVSSDSQNILQNIYPGLPILRIHNAISTLLFCPASVKENTITYMPSKNIAHSRAVFAILKAKGNLQGFQIQPIQGMSEKATAETLGRSKIFASFGFPEGFSLPPAEALAAGNLVVGYHGNGGREFFRPGFTRAVEYWDIMGMVESIEAYIELWTSDPTRAKVLASQGRAFIQETYSEAQEEADIMDASRRFFSP